MALGNVSIALRSATNKAAIPGPQAPPLQVVAMALDRDSLAHLDLAFGSGSQSEQQQQGQPIQAEPQSTTSGTGSQQGGPGGNH